MISSRAFVGFADPVEEMIGPRALASLLERVDLPETVLRSFKHYVPQSRQLSFFEGLSQAIKGEACLELAKHASISTFGKFADYVSAAETFGDAIHLACAMMPYHTSHDRLSLQTKGNLAFWNYHSVLRNVKGYRHYAVLAARVMASLGERYITGKSLLDHVGFDFPKPANVARYEQLFGCEIRFQQPSITLAYKRSALSCAQLVRPSKMTTLNDIVLEVTTPAPKESLAAVEAMIRLGLEEGSVEMGQVARRLGFGERTLRRRMDEFGISYRDLVLKTRIDKARELIAETDIPIIEIGLMLGYSDASHFGRAFKRLTGMAPSEVRRTDTEKSTLDHPAPSAQANGGAV
ncbi:helix-turn-helix domain-containing protein [Defluviimonas sp. D31]|uniref:helix-turn-helix domain-containing protein n=1 Tax=Defluviimonas sp. D31 TaxID=3083253 RepID=UPI00296ECE83|nr:helix-turn-helix domain-containing protein [Defluviimonas sp. D31]MDW4550042.1 helix-turn-helix domain-containing protein [Defluviimonas sp. D31]